VACPRHIGKTPVAIGSNVPAWPTWRCLLRCLIKETISCEVLAGGLLMFRIPLIVAAVFFVADIS